jgi:hypothetical protein
MKNLCLAIASVFVAQLCLAAPGGSSAAELTAGWRNNNPSKYRLPPAEKLLWQAPYAEGEGAFEVEWKDGASGVFRVVDTALGKGVEIDKTNDVGTVEVRPKKPFALSGCGRLKCFAAVISHCDNFEFARGVLKVGLRGYERVLSSTCKGLAIGGARRMTWLPNTAPGSYEAKYAFGDEPKPGRDYSSAIQVSGAASRTVWCGWRIEDADEALKAVKTDPKRKPFLSSRSGKADMIGEKEFERKCAADVEHSAKVVRIDGYSRILVDGKEVPAVVYKGLGCSDNIVRFAGANLAGSVALMNVPVNFRALPPRKGIWHEGGFDAEIAVEEIRKAMRCASDSFFVVSLGLNAYPAFTARYPEETWTDRDGKLVCGNFNLANKVVAPGEAPPKGYWPWASYHSLVWREQVKSNLTQLVTALRASGLSKRIVGVHLFGYHDGQFATPIADYSKCAIEAFRRWTGRSDAVPPAMSAKGWLDGAEDAPVIEWLKFQKRAPFAMLEDVARHVKAQFGKDILAFRWCFGPFGGTMTTAWDITPFVESDVFDVIVPQPDYRRRAPALPIGGVMPSATMNRHGKIFMNEFDLRTWGVWLQNDTELSSAGASRVRDIEEWCSVHRKLAGQMIASHSAFWYYDMQPGWFRPDGIARDIADVTGTMRELAKRKASQWKADVAFVIDEESLFRLNLFAYPRDPSYDEDLRENGRMSVFAMISGMSMRLAASGVPYDIYLAKDFDSDKALASSYKYVVRRLSQDDVYITPIEFNARARAAGAYVPVEPNVMQVNMNGDFVSIHALRNGTFDFKLPFPCKVRNLKSKLEEKVDSGKITLNVEAGETCWFGLER